MLKKRWFFLIIVICLLLSGAVGYGYSLKYHSLYNKNKENVIETSKFQLLFTAREFYQFDSQITSTIELLNQNRALMQFVANENSAKKQQVEEIWSTLTGYQSFFKQIRYVDTRGQEQIKVEYSYLEQGAIARSDYKNIETKRYFEFAKTLADGEVGTLGVGLEKALGDSDDPYVPIQHIITPYKHDGVRQGYLILSIDFWLSASLLDFSPQASFRPRVVTLQGDYVVHPDPERLFGFAIPERKQYNLGLSHPKLWHEMKNTPIGVFENDGAIYIYEQVNIHSGNSFYIIIEFTQQQLFEQVREEYYAIIQMASLVMLVIMFAGIPAAYIVYLSQKRNLESKLAMAALNGMSAVMVCDAQYRILKINREFEKITGYRDSQIRYGNLRKMLFDMRFPFGWSAIWDSVKADHSWEGELKILGRSGAELITITRIQAVLDSRQNVTNYIISLVDISERKELEERLRYLSEKDELSQLWNRRKFEAELQNEAQLVLRYPQNHIGCLALLDIDHFKKINDELGHDEGDRVIRQISMQLQQNTRQTDFIARIGGEEFAIIMPHTELPEAEVVLNRIRTSVATDGRNSATISIGITLLTSNATQCYKTADVALYRSKSLGRNQTSIGHSDES
ncbi:diguanylate cyclase [Vibrio sp. MACH09]|uniref:sensor domain-containing diguanylate cyclase n=1 Tax=Vibrio sp. MACH09 TaxID=3025122 RepID=UPI002792DBCD|nr:sensor domain-containing diguanylate cyclase [Vibrio sp. MACH09]GLO62013.1 diguanylate cyclase [Vibrio sp. MACH09]